jgi:hypothetical protein
MKSTAHRTRFARNIHLFACLPILLACSLTGCTICQDCGDLDYPTYGGAWERTRRDSGRVGSVFDPAGVRVAALSPRDAVAEDSSRLGRGEKATPNDDEATPADDPLNDSGTEASPSDKDKDMGDKDADSIRDLDLEDINMETSDLLPPEV